MAKKKAISAKTQTPAAKEKQVIAEFEKHIYDLQQMLEISKSFCSTIEFSPLIESILYVAMAQMRVTGAGLFISEEFGSEYFKLSENYSGIAIDPTIEYKISIDSPLIEFLSSSSAVFDLRELSEKFPESQEIKVIESLNPSLIVPLMLKNHLNGILVMGERIFVENLSADYTTYERNEIQTIASLASVAVHNASLIDQSTTDMMTKLRLKFYFYNILEDKLDSAFSNEQTLSVIMFDIDFFKKFNDTYGHACGDYVLKKVAEIISDSTREGDLASRYGGEEFTVLLCNAGKDEAMLVAERIRKRIEQTTVFYEGHNMQITISGGISVFNIETNPVRSAKILVDQADKALYISKRTGRNRVTIFDPSSQNSDSAKETESALEKSNS
ncbi:diguanylate cyclase DgcA [Treponema sp. UBA6852]|uniref:diguanylate cyclase DgcA n=1 Tax=Treponema sp. UBA6852 TaxID=1947744 RepID=UPI000E8C71E0|nr:diguanylate cyclase DgcA [Treponema sp. UBA6852]HBP08933.1 GGDEF domain-containing protein [Treponema sp.]